MFSSPHLRLSSLAAAAIAAAAAEILQAQANARGPSASDVAAMALEAPDSSLVIYKFPDGSKVAVRLSTVLSHAARSLCVGGISEQTVIEHQLKPSIMENPAILEELIGALSVDDILLHAVQARIVSPVRELFSTGDAQLLLCA